MINLCASDPSSLISTNDICDQYSQYFSCNSVRPNIVIQQTEDYSSRLKNIQDQISKLNNKEPDLIIEDHSTKIYNINWSSLGPGWM